MFGKCLDKLSHSVKTESQCSPESVLWGTTSLSMNSQLSPVLTRAFRKDWCAKVCPAVEMPPSCPWGHRCLPFSQAVWDEIAGTAGL